VNGALGDVRGVAFPFRVDPVTGRIETAQGEAKIRQNVRLILGTRLGERPMLRDFGTRLPALVHDPNDEVLVDIAQNHTREALLRWEPRILVTESQVEREPDEGFLQLRLRYVHTNEQVAGQAVVPLV
jgi:phage baseplate assembly protein W